MKERDKAKRQKELFLSKLEEVPVISILCKKLGIAKSNIYRWQKEDTEFEERYKEAKKNGEENINDLAISVVIQNMKNGSLAAAKYWLDNKHPDFMKDKFRYEEVKPIEPIEFNISVVDKKRQRALQEKNTEKINIKSS